MSIGDMTPCVGVWKPVVLLAPLVLLLGCSRGDDGARQSAESGGKQTRPSAAMSSDGKDAEDESLQFPAIPQIVEFYRMSGDVDYLLRVVVPDIRAYDTVYQRLTKAVSLSDVSSSFAMEEIKFTTALPLNYAQ